MNKNAFRIEKHFNIRESIFLKIWIHSNSLQFILVCWELNTSYSYSYLNKNLFFMAELLTHSYFLVFFLILQRKRERINCARCSAFENYYFNFDIKIKSFSLDLFLELPYMKLTKLKIKTFSTLKCIILRNLMKCIILL